MHTTTRADSSVRRPCTASASESTARGCEY